MSGNDTGIGDTGIFDSIEAAVADIAAGRPVVVVDDEDRENEGDIIFAAAKATPELLAFTIRYTSGVICVPMEGPELDRLQIPLMTAQNTERMRTAYTISVDARLGVTTGISAADQAGRSAPCATRRPSRATWSAPATSSRSATGRAASCGGAGTPRPPSTSPGSPGSPPPASSPRW